MEFTHGVGGNEKSGTGGAGELLLLFTLLYLGQLCFLSLDNSIFQAFQHRVISSCRTRVKERLPIQINYRR